MKEFFSDMRALLGKHKWLTSIFKYAVSFITGACTAILAVNSRIEKVVGDRVGPYEQLLDVIAVSAAGVQRDALESCHQLMNSTACDRLSARSRLVLYDRFLDFVLDADDPHEYKKDMARIRTAVDNTELLTGLRATKIGWYCLETGKLDEAEQYLADGRRRCDLNGDRKSAADAIIGLIYVNMARGDLTRTRSSAEQLLTRRIPNYLLTDLTDWAEHMEDVPFQRRLQLMYQSSFEDARNDLLEYFRGKAAMHKAKLEVLMRMAEDPNWKGPPPTDEALQKAAAAELESKHKGSSGPAPTGSAREGEQAPQPCVPGA